jgi:hypothetical protein
VHALIVLSDSNDDRAAREISSFDAGAFLQEGGAVTLGLQVIEGCDGRGLVAVDQIGVAGPLCRKRRAEVYRLIQALDGGLAAAAATVSRDVEQQWQRPGGDVIEARALAAVDPRARFAQEVVRCRNVRFQ